MHEFAYRRSARVESLVCLATLRLAQRSRPSPVKFCSPPLRQRSGVAFRRHLPGVRVQAAMFAWFAQCSVRAKGLAQMRGHVRRPLQQMEV